MRLLTRSSTRRSRAAGAGALAALLAAVTGCTGGGDGGSSSDPSAEASAEASVGTASTADLSAYYSQEIDTERGSRRTETGTVTVPVDYEDPSAGDLDLAISVWRPKKASDRYLLVNPGGPGGSGIDLAQAVAVLGGYETPDLVGAYNIVGFDPRGVGDSSPLTCLDTAELDDVIASTAPSTDDGEADAEAALDTLVEGCVSTNGDEASHVSTVEAAQDMEVIRQALGADELDYLGFSYGTFLGTTYAALFPENVGRMVLDGALDPQLDPAQTQLGQAEGFQTAFDAWAASCVTKDCPAGDTVEEVGSTVSDLLTEIDADPLPTKDPERPLTGSLAFFGIGAPLYEKDSWPTLTASLADALDGDGSTLLASADTYADRGANTYRSNQFIAAAVVNTLDCQIAGGIQSEVSRDDFVERSPVFGEVLYHATVVNEQCDDVPIQTDLAAPDYSAPGADPILVIGTTRDPATPLVNSENLAEQLDSGVLLVRKGDGHTAFLFSGAPCIDTIVEDYLVDGTVPEDGKRCTSSPS